MLLTAALYSLERKLIMNNTIQKLKAVIIITLVLATTIPINLIIQLITVKY